MSRNSRQVSAVVGATLGTLALLAICGYAFVLGSFFQMMTGSCSGDGDGSALCQNLAAIQILMLVAPVAAAITGVYLTWTNPRPQDVFLPRLWGLAVGICVLVAVEFVAHWLSGGLVLTWIF